MIPIFFRSLSVLTSKEKGTSVEDLDAADLSPRLEEKPRSVGSLTSGLARLSSISLNMQRKTSGDKVSLRRHRSFFKGATSKTADNKYTAFRYASIRESKASKLKVYVLSIQK